MRKRAAKLLLFCFSCVLGLSFLFTASASRARAAELPGDVPDVSALPALPYDFRGHYQNTVYLKNRLIFKDVNGEWMLFDFADDAKPGINLVWWDKWNPIGYQDVLPHTSIIYANLVPGGAYNAYKYINGKWVSQNYVDDGDSFDFYADWVMAPGQEISYSTVDLINANGQVYSHDTGQYFDGSFIDARSNNIYSNSQYYMLGLPSNVSATAVTGQPVLLHADPSPLYICADGIDNDGDHLVDIDDPGCHSDWDASNPNSYNPKARDEGEDGIKRVVKDEGTELMAGASQAAMDGDGTLIAYQTVTSQGTSQTNRGSIFIYDTKSGTSQLMSAALDGSNASGDSLYPSVSSRGDRVVFQSYASNLVPGDTNNHGDIFLRDVASGSTVLVSRGYDGSPANGDSFYPSLGGVDGKYVIFSSEASNLVPDDNDNRTDIFAYNTETGKLIRVDDMAPVSSPVLAADSNQIISVYGNYNPALPGQAALALNILVYDLDTDKLEQASFPSNYFEANECKVSPDGNLIAFASRSGSLVSGDTNENTDVFLYDRQTGSLTRVSLNANGEQPDGGSFAPAISADGKYVAFLSDAADLVSGEVGHGLEMYVRNQETREVKRLSLTFDGSEVNGGVNVLDMTPDGRYVLISSNASNLVRGDVNESQDTFLIKNPFWDGAVDGPKMAIDIKELKPFFGDGEEVHYTPQVKPDYAYAYYDVAYDAAEPVLKEGTALSSYQDIPYALIQGTEKTAPNARIFKIYQSADQLQHAIIQVAVPFSTEATIYKFSMGSSMAATQITPVAEDIKVEEKLIPSGEVGKSDGNHFDVVLLGQKMQLNAGAFYEINLGMATGYESEIVYGGPTGSGGTITVGYPVEGSLEGTVGVKFGAESETLGLDANLADASLSLKGSAADVLYPAKIYIEGDPTGVSSLLVPMAGSVLGMTNPLYRLADLLSFNVTSPYKDLKRRGVVIDPEAKAGEITLILGEQEDIAGVAKKFINIPIAMFENGGEIKFSWEKGNEEGHPIDTTEASCDTSMTSWSFNPTGTPLGDVSSRYDDIKSAKYGADGENGQTIEIQNSPMGKILAEGEAYKKIYFMDQADFAKLYDADGSASLSNIPKALGAESSQDGISSSPVFSEEEYYVGNPQMFDMDLLKVDIALGTGVKFNFALQAESKLQVPLSTYYMRGGIEFPLSVHSGSLSQQLENLEQTKKTTSGIMYQNAKSNLKQLSSTLAKAILGTTVDASVALDAAKQNVTAYVTGSPVYGFAAREAGDAAQLGGAVYQAAANWHPLGVRAVMLDVADGSAASATPGINNANLNFAGYVVALGLAEGATSLPQGGMITLYPYTGQTLSSLADVGVYRFDGTRWVSVPATVNVDGSFTFELKETGIYALIHAFAEGNDFLTPSFVNLKPDATQTIASGVVLNADGSVARNQTFDVTLTDGAVIDGAGGEVNYGQAPASFPASVTTDQEGRFQLDLSAGSSEGEAYLTLKSESGYASTMLRVIVTAGSGFDGDFKLGMETSGFAGKMPQAGEEITLTASTSYSSDDVEWKVVDLFGNQQSYSGQEAKVKMDKAGVYKLYCQAQDKNGFWHTIYGELPVTDPREDGDGDGISDSVEDYYGLDKQVSDSDQFYAALEAARGNQVPVAEAGAGYRGMEGQAVSFDASGSSDADGDQLSYRWDFDGDGTWDSEWSASAQASHVFADDFSGEARVEVSDGKLESEASAPVRIENAAPSIEAIANQAAEAGDEIRTSVSFTDAGTADAQVATINWGDGSERAEIALAAGLQSIDLIHTYARPGSYAGSLQVKDDDGGVAQQPFLADIAKRTTSLEYAGEASGRFSASIELGARLMDKNGALAGKTVSFELGSKVVTAVTDSEGRAAATVALGEVQANYLVYIRFAEDDLYQGNQIEQQLRVQSPRQVKQNAASRLGSLAAQLPAADGKRMTSNLESVLTDELWSDGYHLSAQQGKKMFDREKQVLKGIVQLQAEKKTPLSGSVKDGLQTIGDDLIFSDRALISLALTEAQGLTGSKFIAQQQKQIAAAQLALKEAENETDLIKKIDRLRQAWDSARRAIEFGSK